MVVLRGGTHIENNEEEWSACAGTYLWMRDKRQDGCCGEPETNTNPKGQV